MSRVELKKHIETALDRGDQKTADRLLALASTVQSPTEDMVRKSVRIGTGEYLALYRLKLELGSSFSDIVTDVVRPRILSYLRERVAPLVAGQRAAKMRLDHLEAQIEAWSKNKPESRTKEADWEADLPGVIAMYPYKVDDVKEAFLGIVFGDLDDIIRRVNYTYLESGDNVYQHFRELWLKEIGEDVVSSTFLEASVSENGVRFVPVVSPNGKMWYDGKDLEAVFDAFGEDEVRGFAKTMDRISEIPEKFKQTDRENEMAYFRMRVRLPAFVAKETGPDEFEVECQEKRPFEEKKIRDAYALEEMVKRAAVKLDQDPNSYFRKEYDLFYAREERGGQIQSFGEILARCQNLTRFIRLATKLANAPEEFATVRELSRMGNRVRGYSMVLEFLETLVRSSLERHKVISFYVNADVWRVMPLALEQTNWVELVNKASSRR
ncbi:MAG: hypothetical protein HY247_08190 [archaeon]|nr:MAG: hypothetical protein HY247_08190 [archaeon]